jgi:hypothetical protein
MRSRPPKHGPDVSNTVKSILGLDNRKLPPLPGGRLGQEWGRILAEIAIELQDKIDEAKSWRTMCEAVRGETKTLVSILLRRDSSLDGKLVITKGEFDHIPENAEVIVETPEPGVRIYRMTTKEAAAVQKSPIVLQ